MSKKNRKVVKKSIKTKKVTKKEFNPKEFMARLIRLTPFATILDFLARDQKIVAIEYARKVGDKAAERDFLTASGLAGKAKAIFPKAPKTDRRLNGFRWASYVAEDVLWNSILNHAKIQAKAKDKLSPRFKKALPILERAYLATHTVR